jgi:hypothetical protein
MVANFFISAACARCSRGNRPGEGAAPPTDCRSGSNVSARGNRAAPRFVPGPLLSAVRLRPPACPRSIALPPDRRVLHDKGQLSGG